MTTVGCRSHSGSVSRLVVLARGRCRVQTVLGRRSLVSNRPGRDGVAEAPFARGREMAAKKDTGKNAVAL
jgi:hypothetical protein